MTNDPRVDAYLDSRPADQRELLAAVRRRVKELVPDATELISYDMTSSRCRRSFSTS